MTMMNWATTAQEYDLLNAIANRAVKLAAKHGAERLKRDVLMDLNAAHCNAFPLRLDELLVARDGDFAHDVFGIMRHLNRETGKLEDCFVPRFAARKLPEPCAMCAPYDEPGYIINAGQRIPCFACNPGSRR